jgi:hypothetical protein
MTWPSSKTFICTLGTSYFVVKLFGIRLDYIQVNVLPNECTLRTSPSSSLLLLSFTTPPYELNEECSDSST